MTQSIDKININISNAINHNTCDYWVNNGNKDSGVFYTPLALKYSTRRKARRKVIKIFGKTP